MSIPSSRARRRWGVLLSQAVAMVAPGLALAGSAFNSGSATWSWDADTNSTAGGKTTFAIAPPSSSAIPLFQLNRTGTSGSATANGKGSIGYVSNATTATYTFAGGTGAAQIDPDDLLTGNTVTKVQFGGLFDATGSGFGPTATGYFSLTVAGTAGVDGFTQVAFDMQFRRNNASGTLLRSNISGGQTFLGGAAPTPFSRTFTYSSAFSPSTIPAGEKVFVSGSMTLIASNGGTPSDVLPIQLEAGAAPPTATSFITGGAPAQWLNALTWQPPAGSFTELNAAIPTIPNSPGERARFIDVGSQPRTVVIDDNVTLGSLHIDDNDSLSIQDSPSGGLLTFDTQAGNATVYVGAAAGAGEHNVSVPVELSEDLEIRSQSDRPFLGGSLISFTRPISRAVTGPERGITVTGSGFTNFNSANSYGGQTTVTDGGTLRINADGGLSTGSVIVNGGRLVINTPNPFAAGSTASITVNNGGVVELGVTGTQGFVIDAQGGASGISGSSAVLGAVVISVFGTPGNLNAPGGAFIGHTQFDLSAAGNPQNLGVFEGGHIFGCSANFVGPVQPVIDIGDQSGGPWTSLGGDQGNFIFGSDPDAPLGAAVNVVGSAGLESRGGEFIVNARITGDADSSIFVTGPGIVSLESTQNTFAGNIRVADGGTLRVDGFLSEVQTVTVAEGGLLGGNGTLSDLTNFNAQQEGDPTPSMVVVQAGGTLDPGINLFDNAVASFEVDNLVLQEGALLNFEFGGIEVNDSISVNGDLTLDGELIVNQLQNFDELDEYTLFFVDGTIIDNGLAISPLSQEILGFPAAEIASIEVRAIPEGGGSLVVLVIPEPSTLGLLGLAAAAAGRRRRK